MKIMTTIRRVLALLLIFFTVFTASAQKKKLLMVVPPDLYHDTEFSDPMLALDSAKIEVTIASLKTGTIKGVMKDSIQSTLLLADAKVKNYDAICIMGGKGTGQYLWDNEEVNRLVRQFKDKGKLVTAICAGSVALAKAGVLDGVTATTYPVKGFIKQLEDAGASYSTDPVVVDGKVITANGPDGAKAFGMAIVNCLVNKK